MLGGWRSQLSAGIPFYSRAVLIKKDLWWWRVLDCGMNYWSGCLRLETCLAGRTYLDSVAVLVWWYWLNTASLRWPLRSDRGCKFSLCNRRVALVDRSVRLIPHISLAALLCTASRWLVAVSDAESHEAEAYSRTGRTSCLYAVDFTCSDVVRMLRLTKPRLKCPLAAVLITWAFQFTFESIVTPRYLILSALGIAVPWRYKGSRAGSLLREKDICWHLAGWNSISQSLSHCSSLAISSWSSWWFFHYLTGNTCQTNRTVIGGWWLLTFLVERAYKGPLPILWNNTFVEGSLK